MDTRALISGTLASICIIGAILLAAIPATTNSQSTIDACIFLASTFGGYVVGLYSTPTNRASSDGEPNA